MVVLNSQFGNFNITALMLYFFPVPCSFMLVAKRDALGKGMGVMSGVGAERRAAVPCLGEPWLRL